MHFYIDSVIIVYLMLDFNEIVFFSRTLPAPLVPRPAAEGIRLPLHTDQSWNGPSDWPSGRPHRTDQRAAFLAPAAGADALGRPVRSLLPHRRGRLHLRSLRGRAARLKPRPLGVRPDGELQKQLHDGRPNKSAEKLPDDGVQLSARPVSDQPPRVHRSRDFTFKAWSFI